MSIRPTPALSIQQLIFPSISTMVEDDNRVLLPQRTILFGAENSGETDVSLSTHNGDEAGTKRQKVSHLGTQLVRHSATPGNMISGKSFPSFDKAPLIELLSEYFPHRHHLGSIIYNPTTTWATLQSERLIGIKPEHVQMYVDLKERYIEKLQDKEFLAEIKYIPVIPPLPVEYSNSYLEIKIPNRFFKVPREEKERSIWGGNGGIYTDDSDILSVLKHQGLFDGTIDLSVWNDGWTAGDILGPGALDSTLDFDISVTLLLLPPLPLYHGYYANGINPRSWSKLRRKHSGISYVVYDVKWESGGTYLADKNIFKQAIEEDLESNKVAKRVRNLKDGWDFNVEYFHELKQKYDKLDDKKKKQEEDEKKAAPEATQAAEKVDERIPSPVTQQGVADVAEPLGSTEV